MDRSRGVGIIARGLANICAMSFDLATVDAAQSIDAAVDVAPVKTARARTPICAIWHSLCLRHILRSLSMKISVPIESPKRCKFLFPQNPNRLLSPL
jgi:hypothetical protein